MTVSRFVLLLGLTLPTAILADGLDEAVLTAMDACLVDSATGRDVANSTIACFNTARNGCRGEVLACETAMTEALAERAAGLRARMPSELEGVPEFAKERYLEIIGEIDSGAASMCEEVPEAGMISCAYRAEALRFARLRSVASQLDPRFLIP